MAILGLIPLCGFVLYCRRLLGVDTSTAVLHGVSALILTVYVAALAGVLLPVALLLWVAGVLLLLVELRRSKMALPELPLIVLVVASVIVWLLHGNGQYMYYDEYSYWGLQLKDMLAADALWGADSNVIHRRYVPGATLWQYFFLRPVATGDGAGFVAQFVLLFAPLVVLWRKVGLRQVGWSLGILALVLAALANFGHGIASLYVDHVLGAWFAGTLIGFLLDAGEGVSRRLWWYALPITTIAIIKDSGLYFALAATGIAGLLVLARGGLAAASGQWRGRFAAAAALIAVCTVSIAATAASWNHNRNAAGIPVETVSLAGIARGILAGETNMTPEQAAEFDRRYHEVVWNQQISKDEVSLRYNAFSYPIMSQFTDRFRLTTGSTLVLFLLWSAVMLAWLVPAGRRLEVATLSAGLVAAAVVYMAVLYMSYRFAFEDRGLVLSSYVRFLHTALLPILLFAFVPLLPAFSSDRTRWRFGTAEAGRNAVVFSTLLVALYVFETPYLKRLVEAPQAPPARAQLEPLTARLAEAVGDGRLWVYFPVPDSNGLFGRIIKFQMSPVPTEVSVDPVLLTGAPDTARALIAAADYIWLPIATPEFDAAFQALTGHAIEQRVMRVEGSAEELRLVPVPGVFD